MTKQNLFSQLNLPCEGYSLAHCDWSGLQKERQLGQLSFFDISIYGVPVAIFGMIYMMLFAPCLLPGKKSERRSIGWWSCAQSDWPIFCLYTTITIANAPTWIVGRKREWLHGWLASIIVIPRSWEICRRCWFERTRWSLPCISAVNASLTYPLACFLHERQHTLLVPLEQLILTNVQTFFWRATLVDVVINLPRHLFLHWAGMCPHFRRGSLTISAIGPEFVIAEHDILFFTGVTDHIKSLADTFNFYPITHEHEE